MKFKMDHHSQDFATKCLFFTESTFLKDKCLCLLLCFLGVYLHGSSILFVSMMLCK